MKIFILIYIIIGFLIGMLMACIDIKWGNWQDGDETICAIAIVGWPAILLIGIGMGIGKGLTKFYKWFANCINKKNIE